MQLRNRSDHRMPDLVDSYNYISPCIVESSLSTMPPRPQEPISRSIRRSQQCTGHTKTGARCKRRTARTSLCWTHLLKEQHLRIKPSQIPGAGMGLYTTIRRPPHRMIAPYTGRPITRPENTYIGDYVIQLNNAPPYKYVDANHTTDAAGRYANNARRRDHFTNNSHLSPDPAHPHQAKVVASRPIPAGREVFARYGDGYWN